MSVQSVDIKNQFSFDLDFFESIIMKKCILSISRLLIEITSRQLQGLCLQTGRSLKIKRNTLIKLSEEQCITVEYLWQLLKIHAGKKAFNCQRHQIICFFSFRGSDIHEWVMESFQEKNEVSLVPGTLRVADGRPDVQDSHQSSDSYIQKHAGMHLYKESSKCSWKMELRDKNGKHKLHFVPQSIQFKMLGIILATYCISEDLGSLEI